MKRLFKHKCGCGFVAEPQMWRPIPIVVAPVLSGVRLAALASALEGADAKARSEALGNSAAPGLLRGVGDRFADNRHHDFQTE